MGQGFGSIAGLVLCLAASHAIAGQLPGTVPQDAAPPLLTLVPPPLLPSEAAAFHFQTLNQPILADQPADDNSDNVYAVPTPPREDEGVNNGAVHVDLNVAYFNRYIYRGVDHDAVSRRGNALNLTIDTKLSFDTGKWPHPFVGIFSNVYDSDPVSRFQEIRPYFGADWNLRPFLISFGGTSYIYPERENFNTAEAFGKFSLDDSLFFGTEKPVFSPYIMAAYDYTQNHGWYFEAGLSYNFVIEDLGLTITPKADLAYILHLPQNFVFTDTTKYTGWQHMDVGFDVSYSLNTLLNVSRRYGEFDLKGYITYTEKMSRDVLADNVVWGGGGIDFSY